MNIAAAALTGCRAHEAVPGGVTCDDPVEPWTGATDGCGAVALVGAGVEVGRRSRCDRGPGPMPSSRSRSRSRSLARWLAWAVPVSWWQPWTRLAGGVGVAPEVEDCGRGWLDDLGARARQARYPDELAQHRGRPCRLEVGAVEMACRGGGGQREDRPQQSGRAACSPPVCQAPPTSSTRLTTAPALAPGAATIRRSVSPPGNQAEPDGRGGPSPSR